MTFLTDTISLGSKVHNPTNSSKLTSKRRNGPQPLGVICTVELTNLLIGELNWSLQRKPVLQSLTEKCSKTSNFPN